jgi:hypothetical protein
LNTDLPHVHLPPPPDVQQLSPSLSATPEGASAAPAPGHFNQHIDLQHKMTFEFKATDGELGGKLSV